MYDEDIFKQQIHQRLSNIFNNYNLSNLLKLVQDKNSFTTILENIVDSIMLAERDYFLNTHPDEYANGFQPKILNTQLDRLDLSVPRTRESNFRPVILPDKYKRSDESFVQMIQTLIASGNSKSKIKSILKQYNLNFSEELYDIVSQDIDERLNDFKNRELPEKLPFVFIDAFVCYIKEDGSGKIKKSSIYTVIGIDFDGKKQVLGYYTVFGNENVSDWKIILHDLVNRGLKKVILFISDDFTGISNAFSSIYPKSYVQKCYVHLMRNINRQLGKQDAIEFNKELKMIKESKGYEEGKIKFGELCKKYEGRYKGYMKYLESKAEEYLAFLRFPEEIRKYIYTTNIVENFNSLLEKERIRLGGYFQSQNIADRTVFLKIEHLHNEVWKQPNPLIVSKSYELNQMFKLTFEN